MSEARKLPTHVYSDQRQGETNMTENHMTWVEVQASKPDPIGEALKAWHATPDEAESSRMGDAIDAYEAALKLYNQCDEPGCSRDAGCGWPVQGGAYRRTCLQHMKANEHMAAANCWGKP